MKLHIARWCQLLFYKRSMLSDWAGNLCGPQLVSVSSTTFWFGVFAVSFFSRLVYFFLFFDSSQHLTFISKDMDVVAMSMVDGGKDLSDPAFRASFPLFLSYFYGFLRDYGQIEHRHQWLGVLNALLFGLSAIALLAVYRRIGAELSSSAVSRRMTYLISGAYLCCYPLLQLQLGVLSENWFAPILVVFYLLFLVLVDRVQSYSLRDQSLFTSRSDRLNRVVSFVVLCCLLGLLAGFLYGIRPAILPCWLLSIIWLVGRAKLSKESVFSAAIMSIVFLVVVGWIANTNSSFDDYGEANVSSNLGVNFALTWCQPKRIRAVVDGKTERYFSPPALWTEPADSEIVTGVSFRNNLYYVGVGIQCMGLHPERLVTNLLNVGNLFHSVMYPSSIEEAWHHSVMYAWKICTLIFLLWFIAFPFFFGTSGAWVLSVIYLFSLLSSAYAFNPGEERYLPPYLFLLILFAFPSMQAWQSFLYRKLNSNLARIAWVASMGAPVLLALCLTSKWVVREPKISRLQVQTGLAAGIHWLEKNQMADGSFPYYVDLSTKQVLPKESLLRQMVTSHGLANIARSTRDESVLSIHRKNIRYLVSKIVPYNQQSAFLETEAKTNSTNATAFAVMALADSPLRDGYRDTIRNLGRYFIEIQRPDGSFNSIPDRFEAYRTQKILNEIEGFSSGQSIAACSAVYEYLREPEFLNCARRGFEYYSPMVLAGTDNIHFPWCLWHSIGYARLFRITRDIEVGEKVLLLAEAGIRRFQVGLGDSRYIPGGFQKGGKRTSAADAAFSEALAMSGSIANEIGNVGMSQFIFSRLGRSLSALDRHIVFDGDDFHVGAIIDEANADLDKPPTINLMRIDNLGHALMAWHNFLDYLEESHSVRVVSENLE